MYNLLRIKNKKVLVALLYSLNTISLVSIALLLLLGLLLYKVSTTYNIKGALESSSSLAISLKPRVLVYYIGYKDRSIYKVVDRLFLLKLLAYFSILLVFTNKIINYSLSIATCLFLKYLYRVSSRKFSIISFYYT